jgi:hypothetical protein
LGLVMVWNISSACSSFPECAYITIIVTCNVPEIDFSSVVRLHN